MDDAGDSLPSDNSDEEEKPKKEVVKKEDPLPPPVKGHAPFKCRCAIGSCD